MIKNIIDLLVIKDYYAVSETVDIAKGKYEIAYNWSEVWHKVKRYYYGRTS
jgi:hypothetical protein